MSVPLIHQVLPIFGTFSVFIAPAEDLTLALEGCLTKKQGLILYMCGNYPIILPKIQTFSDLFVVRRALTAFQVLTILDEASHSFLIFEHDRSLYEERADLLPIIGQRCREHAKKNSGVLLLARYPDMYIHALEPFFQRVVQIRMIPSMNSAPVQVRHSQQQTLMVV